MIGETLFLDLHSANGIVAGTQTDQGGANEMSGEPLYFFEQGLRFACQRCGNCCTGRAGMVRMAKAEMEQISRHLHLSEDAFQVRYCRLVGDQLSLKEKDTGDCIFYDQGCTIYPVRPAQCRTFPFWVRNLRTEEAWNETAKECHGIGKGPIHDRESILKQVGASPV